MIPLCVPQEAEWLLTQTSVCDLSGQKVTASNRRVAVHVVAEPLPAKWLKCMQYNTDMADISDTVAAVQQGEGRHLREGGRVERTALSSEDLKGQRAADRERWTVAVDGSGRELSCKPASLNVLASCAHCGAEKVLVALKKCTRCRAVHYCNGDCQRAHWKRGGHKQACREQFACTICLDDAGYPLPIQCGCGCREAAGCAHVACKAEYAAHQAPGWHSDWFSCITCKQEYTGAMKFSLAEMLCARLQGRPADDNDRLSAQDNLADSYLQAGRVTEAEPLYLDVLAMRRRLHGPNHTTTLTSAAKLGDALVYQNKQSEAERVYRDTLERQQESLGPEHKDTLHTAGGLAGALQNQYKYAEAEPVLRDTLSIQQRVLGDGNIHTLHTAYSLAMLLTNTGQQTEAEETSRGALAQAKRTLGPEHPHSLRLAYTLANALGQTVEAKALFTDALFMQQHVLGTEHPETQVTAHKLQRFHQRG